jgi:hypothetical protein
VEQHAGARIIDVAKNECAHEVRDRDLNGFGILEHRETIAGLTGKNRVTVVEEMVVAERLAAQSGRSATLSVGANELALNECHENPFMVSDLGRYWKTFLSRKYFAISAELKVIRVRSWKQRT